jgi:hypothetical protein
VKILKTINILFTISLTFACSKTWIRSENSDKIVWKKTFESRNKNYTDSTFKICSLSEGILTNSGKFNDYNFYEFDSIRIYVKKSDEYLNKFIQKGLIKGQYFFSIPGQNNCQLIKW